MRFWNHTKGLVQTAEEIETENVPERKQSVFHADLFPLRVRAAVVADRHFVNNGFGLGDFCRDFDFDSINQSLMV